MAGNSKLGEAKAEKNDEFYTQYSDIESELNAYIEYNPDVFRGKTILCPCDDHEWSNFTRYFANNFTRFGLKKLICTSYVRSQGSKQLTFFEETSPNFNAEKHKTNGKLFTLTHDTNGDGRIDADDIKLKDYLEGDGDFRSLEVTRLRDEVDFIITNPPFSLFREFLNWIMQSKKKFIIVGNKNAITYKEVFPLLKNGEIWSGYTTMNGGRWMIVPKSVKLKSKKTRIDKEGNTLLNISGVCWFSKEKKKKRHEPIVLDTWGNNLKYNKKLKKKLQKDYECESYPHYDNYDAIEVPFIECIPSDYTGFIGVPITFFNRHCPDQYEIIDITKAGAGNPATKTKEYPRQTQVDKKGVQTPVTKLNDGAVIRIKTPPVGKTYYIVNNEIYIQVYPRILIKKKESIQ